MRRREFTQGIASSTVAWPLAARAQQGERVRRVAVLMGVAEDALNKMRVAAFLARLDELGWKDGHNLQTDVRWWAGGPEQIQPVVTDMLSSSPDGTSRSDRRNKSDIMQTTGSAECQKQKTSTKT